MGSMSSVQSSNADGRPQPSSRQSFDGQRQDRQPSLSRASRLSPNAQARQNLDYLSLNDTPFTTKHAGSPSTNMQGQPMGMQNGQGYMNNAQSVAKPNDLSGADWEALVGSMDSGMNNVYDVIYGGASIEAAMTVNSTGSEWSPDAWDLSNFNIDEFGNNPAPPQSVLSMSDESLSSGEEVSPSELGLGLGSIDYGKQLQGNYHGDGYATNGLHGLSLWFMTWFQGAVAWWRYEMPVWSKIAAYWCNGFDLFLGRRTSWSDLRGLFFFLWLFSAMTWKTQKRLQGAVTRIGCMRDYMFIGWMADVDDYFLIYFYYTKFVP
jgi:hypothetical protein